MAKWFRYLGGHYLSAEEPVAGLIVRSYLNVNETYIGGGTGLANAATAIKFYTAPDYITTTGTERMCIDSLGKVTVADTLEVDGYFDHDGSRFGVFGVAPASRTAAYSVVNAVEDRTFDADTVNVSELANVVATIINDLKLYGFFQ